MLESRIKDGTWLHARLAETARELVGIDVDDEGVEWAKAHGFEAHTVDATDHLRIAGLNVKRADLVIAGEVIEHVDAPGPLLRSLQQLADRLIVTTPNALTVMNTLTPLAGKELVHPDHVAWFSPTTLARMLTVSGWTVERMLYYDNGANPVAGNNRLKKIVANAVRALASRHASDGLVAVASQPAAYTPTRTP